MVEISLVSELQADILNQFYADEPIKAFQKLQ
jgi:hypothetical protein